MEWTSGFNRGLYCLPVMDDVTNEEDEPETMGGMDSIPIIVQENLPIELFRILPPIIWGNGTVDCQGPLSRGRSPSPHVSYPRRPHGVETSVVGIKFEGLPLCSTPFVIAVQPPFTVITRHFACPSKLCHSILFA
jgi:hypothetical protein